MSRTVLFLCTGNYYRSRFAELLFNSLAARAHLDWKATSRGIATEFGIQNIGPISPFTVKALRARGIRVDGDIRHPMSLQEQDLEGADLIIALNEAEHRPLLGARFPKWTKRAHYWRVYDLDAVSADEALVEIEREVRMLIKGLSSG